MSNTKPVHRRAPSLPREPRVAAFAANAQRYVVLAMLISIPLVIARPALQPFSTAKSTVLLGGAVLLCGFQVLRTTARGAVDVPWRWFGGVTVAFVAALIVATTVAAWRPSAVFGVLGRETGVLAYLSSVVVFACVARRFQQKTMILTSTVAVTVAVVSAIALVQRVSPQLIPFELVEESVGVNGTLANPNFLSGFIGVGLPLVVARVIRTRTMKSGVVGTLAVLLCVGGLWASDSVQGWIAGTAGLAVGALLLIAQWPPARRRIGLIVWGATAAVGVALGVIGLMGRGPLGLLGEQSAFAVRQWYWSGAIDMWRDHPVFGVGLDQYASFYRRYRPLEDVVAYDVNLVNDAAHNVPLMMLSGGGLMLAGAYLLFVGFVAATVIKAMRHRTSVDNLLLAGLAGAWTAYHVQSLVSIDVTPLMIMHFALAGALLATDGTATVRTVTLPWQRRHAGRVRVAPVVAWAGATLAAAVTIVGLAAASWPLRADLAAGRGSRMLSAGEAELAAIEFREAVDVSRGRPRYGVLLGGALYTAGQFEEARDVFTATATRARGHLEATIWAARARLALNDVDGARTWYRAALAIEPNHPTLKVEAAKLEADQGHTRLALQLIEEALRVDPGHGAALELRNELLEASALAVDYQRVNVTGT